MKLFSNFDTKAPAKHYAQAVQEYGFDRVGFIRRHKFYLFAFVILPFLLVALVLAGYLVLQFMVDGAILSDQMRILLYIARVVVFIFFIIVFIFAIGKYFNYLLDYTIITPQSIVAYNQGGFFKRKITSIETDKIKTINVSSAGFWTSFFNFGEVDILLEGDENGNGEIKLNYVHNPEQVKELLKTLTFTAPQSVNNTPIYIQPQEVGIQESQEIISQNNDSTQEAGVESESTQVGTSDK